MSGSVHLDVAGGGVSWGWENGRQVGDVPSFTRGLYKGGVAAVTFEPGAEKREAIAFLQVIQRASDDSADDAEDLRSLLWHLELQHIRCELREEPRKTEAVASEPREPEAVPALELPTSSDLAVLLGGLRPEGLGTIMRWLSKAESGPAPAVASLAVEQVVVNRLG